MIGDEIEISVLAVKGESIRIGIEAPRSIPVFRTELYVQIQRERAEEDDPGKVAEALDGLKLG